MASGGANQRSAAGGAVGAQHCLGLQRLKAAMHRRRVGELRRWAGVEAVQQRCMVGGLSIGRGRRMRSALGELIPGAKGVLGLSRREADERRRWMDYISVSPEAGFVFQFSSLQEQKDQDKILIRTRKEASFRTVHRPFLLPPAAPALCVGRPFLAAQPPVPLCPSAIHHSSSSSSHLVSATASLLSLIFLPASLPYSPSPTNFFPSLHIPQTLALHEPPPALVCGVYHPALSPQTAALPTPLSAVLPTCNLYTLYYRTQIPS
jgi:hypothetical protein